MVIELFILGGYGQFVWPAFIFAFMMYSYLYFKIKAELEKQEKMFLLEFKEFKNRKIEFTKKNKNYKRSFIY